MNENTAALNNNESPEDKRSLLVADAERAYGRSLKAHLCRSCDAETAADVLQDLWLKCLKPGSRVPDEGLTCLPYLKRVSFNLLLDELRRRKTRRKREDKSALQAETAPPQASFLARHLGSEAEAFKRFWREHPTDGLTQEEKRIVFGRAWHGWSYEEIKALTGMPVSTACDLMAKARRLLKGQG